MRPVLVTGVIALAGLALSARGATPVLQPIGDAATDPFRRPNVILSATDADPADVLTFELVHPTTGAVSPLTAFLEPQAVAPPAQGATLRWFPSALEAGFYPLRAVVRDADGNADSADFLLTVHAAEDDIGGGVIEGPTIVPFNSPEHPEPYRYTVDATSALGLDLEYEIRVQHRDENQLPIYTIYPFQASREFDLTFAEPDYCFPVLWARSALSRSPTWLTSLRVLAYTPGDLLPADSPPTAQLTGPGRILLRWQPHPDNRRVARYRVQIHGVLGIVEDVLEVADPLEEPAVYEAVFDFGDPTRDDLRELIRWVNVLQADSPPGSFGPQVSVVIRAESSDAEEVVLFAIYRLELFEFFPHVASLEVEEEPTTRQVRVTLGPIVSPGGYYDADEVRLFWNRYGRDPSDYHPVPAPMQGGTVILHVDGEPIPSGHAQGVLYASVVDRSLVAPDLFEGGLYEAEVSLDPADCHDGIDNDGDGLIDADGGDIGCADATDTDEFDRGDSLDLTSRVLVAFNTNTTDAAEIAEYYRAARGLPQSALCPVALPPGGYASMTEMLGARRVLVEQCICENVLGRSASECVDVDARTLASPSPITHLVLIKGIPERLMETGWVTDDQEPAFDYYFAWSIYANIQILVESGADGNIDHRYPGTAGDAIDHQPTDSIRGHVRPVHSGLDKMLAYGRIVAIDRERTLALIDRTIAAEQIGFRGNLLEQGNDAVFDFFRELTASHDDPDPAMSCTGYVDDPLQDWPHDRCRAGTTATSLIPGEPARDGLVQSIPVAVDAGLYLGTGLPENGHHAFRGFDNMLAWRREHPDDAAELCIPLCRDHGTTAEVDACREASTDYFREIDTRCVGAAAGFMGWQFRSWPVQYYGFQPPGWGLDKDGAREKTVPYPRDGSPFGDRYVHFGALDAVEDPICDVERGPVQDCPERLFVSLKLGAMLEAGHADAAAFAVRMRYRRGGATGGRLKARIDFKRDDGQSFSAFEWFDLAEARPDWTEITATVNVPEAAAPLAAATLRFESRRGDELAGWLDLDHVELFDTADPVGQNLLPADVADFEAPYLGPTQPGDWAANAIDRLGGIAWWGSASHHLTNGFAFFASEGFAGAFFGGRTLGEALLYTGGRAKSGIIYGDPLYRPSGARVYLDEGTPDLSGRYVVVGGDTEAYDPAAHTVFVDAFHGHANLGRTRWEVARCDMADIAACDTSEAWTMLESNAGHGVNAVVGHALSVEPLELFDLARLDEDQDVVLRLRVWNPRETGHELFSHALVRLTPPVDPAPEVHDVRIAPERPGIAEDLYAIYSFSDPDGGFEAPEERVVNWRRNGAPVATLDGAMIVPGNATLEGEHWTVGIRVSDGSNVSETVWSRPVTIGCGAPPLALSIVMVDRVGSDGVQFGIEDPNPTGQATGYNLYRGTAPGSLMLFGTDLQDGDAGTAGIQIVDAGAVPSLAFYRLTAFNAECAAEGP